MNNFTTTHIIANVSMNFSTTPAPIPIPVVPMVDTFSLVIGTCYTTVGIVFMILQSICAYLIATDKEMTNPTYKFVLNLCIVDAIELLVLGPYAGISIILGYQVPAVGRFMSWACMSFWYANCILFVFIAFSRWIAITRSHLTGYLFRRRAMLCLHVAAWVPVMIICFFGIITTEYNEFPLWLDVYTWSFDTETEIGEVWHWVDCAFNLSSAIIEMGLSLTSWIYVHNKRKEIRSLAASENRRREVKLLLQCFITGCIFFMAGLMFAIVNFAGMTSVSACLVVQTLWFMNHSLNPIIYLSVNTRLRAKFVKFVTCGKMGKPNSSSVAPVSVGGRVPDQSSVTGMVISYRK